MEELRSVEAIDNEIKNESRKKAARIIQKAEENAQTILSGVEERLQQAQKDAIDSSRQKMALFEKNINASLPLEKQRLLVSYINSSVIDAMNEYFKSMPEDSCMELMQKFLEPAKKILSGTPVNAFIYNMDLKKTQAMLKKSLGSDLLSVQEGKLNDLADEALEGFELRKGMILKSQDNGIKCRVTLDQRLKELLDLHNQELACALFGGRLPE